MIDLTKSKAAFEEAKKYMPGGVNSPVRSYPHMGCPPPFIKEAHGSHITDIDGNTHIDYVGSRVPGPGPRPSGCNQSHPESR